jgi:trans-2,3-dihydro-3-hydroxyanthranilate isomerase
VLSFRHVDVFAEAPYAGNGLIVVSGGVDASAQHLLAITRELRQFETIFVAPMGDGRHVRARIFTVDEELPFAGHPVIGAAAVLHERAGGHAKERKWTFAIAAREIEVRSRSHRVLEAWMNQGEPSAAVTLDPSRRAAFAAALSLSDDDLADLPAQVISTGLPYLIVPVTAHGLQRARIVTSDFEQRLAAVGAKFVYVFDPAHREGRTWDNAGAVEDIATGSAAGPAAAYLEGLGLADAAAGLTLHQGRFVERPSAIAVERDAAGCLWVGGPVARVAEGQLQPPWAQEAAEAHSAPAPARR